MKRNVPLVVLAALALLFVLAGTALAAQAGTKRVGLVIGLPDGKSQAQVVTVPANAKTFDVLKAAKITLVSADTQFGPAVCSINGTGCASASNCFCDPKQFWAYFHLDPASKKWVAAQEGVGAYVPAEGAVEGFVYTSADANFNPTSQPPLMTFEAIQAQSTAKAPQALPVTGAAGGLVLAGLGAGLAALGFAVRARR